MNAARLCFLGIAAVMAGPGPDFFIVNNDDPYTCTSIVKWFQDLECCNEANADMAIRPTLGTGAFDGELRCPGIDVAVTEDPIRLSESYGVDIIAWKNASSMKMKEVYEQTLLPLQSKLPQWKSKCEADGYVADGEFVEVFTRECFLFGLTKELVTNMAFWVNDAPAFILEPWWGKLWYDETSVLLANLGSVVYFDNNPTVTWSYAFAVDFDLGERRLQEGTKAPASFTQRIPKRKQIARSQLKQVAHRKLGDATEEFYAAFLKEISAKWSNVLSHTKTNTIDLWKFRDTSSLLNAMPYLARYRYYSKVLLLNSGLELGVKYEPAFQTSPTVVVAPEVPPQPGFRQTVIALHHPLLTEADTARLWLWQTDINSAAHNCTVFQNGQPQQRNGCDNTECSCDLDIYEPNYDDRPSQSRKIYKDGLLWFIFDLNVREAGSFNFILTVGGLLDTRDVRMASPLIAKLPEKNDFTEIPVSQQVFVKYASDLDTSAIDAVLPDWSPATFDTQC